MAAYIFAYMSLAQLSSTKEMQRLEGKYRLNHCSNCDEQHLTPFKRKYSVFIKDTTFSCTEASATAYLVPNPVAPLPSPELGAGKCITFCTTPSHPLSRGCVRIQSSNMNTIPEGRFNYYSNQFDVEVYARHLLVLQTLADAPAFSEMIKRTGKRDSPVLDLNSAEDVLKHTATINYHPCGSCAMLPEHIEAYSIRDSRFTGLQT